LTEKLQVRWPRKKDFAGLADLLNRSPEPVWCPRTLAKFLQERPGNHIRLLTDGRRLLGAVLYSVYGTDYCLLHEFAIVPDRWREGLGTYLMTRVLTGPRARMKLPIRAFPRNSRAEKFLEKLGFEDRLPDEQRPRDAIRFDFRRKA
jgi:N-acetylglutamate synthase-like GNAT family acetyltransferase